MAPKIKTSEEDILAAALEILRDSGIDAVNARSIAKKLGCSIQPIFRTFNTMDALKAVLYKRASEIFSSATMTALNNGGFKNMGMTYIAFARTEKNIFKLLYMTDAFKGQSLTELAGTTEGDVQVLQHISERTELSAEKARELFTTMWFTTHGIAALIATNESDISDESAGRILGKVYDGLMKIL
jgi:AcrR family transcriptional regulator